MEKTLLPNYIYVALGETHPLTLQHTATLISQQHQVIRYLHLQAATQSSKSELSVMGHVA